MRLTARASNDDTKYSSDCQLFLLVMQRPDLTEPVQATQPARHGSEPFLLPSAHLEAQPPSDFDHLSLGDARWCRRGRGRAALDGPGSRFCELSTPRVHALDFPTTDSHVALTSGVLMVPCVCGMAISGTQEES